MTEDDKSVLKSILDHISRMDYIKPKDLPNIDLYMDQVTTFMEDQLASTKRHDERSPSYADLYLLLQEYSVHHRYPEASWSHHREIL